MEQFNIGVVGLGVMGCNIAYNIADKGFSVLGFDLDAQKGNAFVQGALEGHTLSAVNSYQQLAASLATPRQILIMVPAGHPVDSVITGLTPFLSKGDVIIDGGNSFYKDTLRRVEQLRPNDVHFMGAGISGGEMGARFGPSIMPGGDLKAFTTVQPILEAIAARVDGIPCTAYMGKDAAGHYVKMVHNGIEYAAMQLISEAYDLLHRAAGLTNDELSSVFERWNAGKLNSFLIEITSHIFKHKDQNSQEYLIDKILDRAGAKGTGKWTSQEAMDKGVSIPTIDTAVSVRTLSSYKEQRLLASALFPSEEALPAVDRETFIQDMENGLFLAVLISYAQGLDLLASASEQLDMDIELKNVVSVWRGGCIIRSTLLEKFFNIYAADATLRNILLDADIASLVKANLSSLRHIVGYAVANGIPVLGLQSALGYLDAYKTARLPVNLIQAQRDYFGAHTYERIDRAGTFHTSWSE